MGPPSYIWSVIDRNVIMRRILVVIMPLPPSSDIPQCNTHVCN